MTERKMKKYIIDMGTPKQVLFFKPLYKELKKRGHEVTLTTRDNPESLALIKHFKMPALQIGKFGTDRYTKTFYGIQRAEELLPLFERIKPDGLITLAEPNIIRLAFGLGIPIYNFIDIPEAEGVCKLTLPLAYWNFIPFVVPRDSIMRLGGTQIYVYDCLDPIAWLPKKSGQLDTEFQFKDKQPLIVWRRGEISASYYKDEGFQDITPLMIDELKKRHPHYHFYEIPRYQSHKIVNLSSLLDHANLFIGGGGTIQIESAYWGTWTITTRPFKTFYDDFLISEGLMARTKTIEEGVKLAEGMLKGEPKNKSCELLRKMKFPVKEICDKIESGD